MPPAAKRCRRQPSSTSYGATDPELSYCLKTLRCAALSRHRAMQRSGWGRSTSIRRHRRPGRASSLRHRRRSALSCSRCATTLNVVVARSQVPEAKTNGRSLGMAARRSRNRPVMLPSRAGRQAHLLGLRVGPSRHPCPRLLSAGPLRETHRDVVYVGSRPRAAPGQSQAGGHRCKAAATRPVGPYGHRTQEIGCSPRSPATTRLAACRVRRPRSRDARRQQHPHVRPAPRGDSCRGGSHARTHG